MMKNLLIFATLLIQLSKSVGTLSKYNLATECPRQVEFLLAKAFQSLWHHEDCLCSVQWRPGMTEKEMLVAQALSIGGIVSQIDFEEFSPGFRGLVATQDIKVGDMVIFVPEQLLIQKHSAISTPTWKQLEQNKGFYRSEGAYFTIFQLEQSLIENSFWKFFVDSTYTGYSEFPIFFSEDELAYLAGTDLLERVEKTRERLSSDYAVVCEEIPEFCSNFSIDEFIAMYLAVKSRQLSNHDGMYSAPIVDFMNHDENYNVQVVWDNQSHLGEGLMVFADRNIKKGEQILWHYGYKGNQKFLKDYGFILLDGSQPEMLDFVLHINVDSHWDSLWREREYALGDMIGRVSFWLSDDPGTGDCDILELLSTIRLLHVSDKRTFKLIEKEYRDSLVPTLSLRNEKLVFRFLLRKLEDAVFNYPRSLEQDKDILSEGGLSRNVHNALQITSMEKRVIRSLRQWCEEVLFLLEQDADSMIEELVRKMKRKDCRGRKYLSGLLAHIMEHYHDPK